MTTEEPCRVKNLTRGRETRVVGKCPEGAKGQESYRRVHWVKLVGKRWCVEAGLKLQGWLKPKMEAGSRKWVRGCVLKRS